MGQTTYNLADFLSVGSGSDPEYGYSDPGSEGEHGYDSDSPLEERSCQSINQDVLDNLACLGEKRVSRRLGRFIPNRFEYLQYGPEIYGQDYPGLDFRRMSVGERYKDPSFARAFASGLLYFKPPNRKFRIAKQIRLGGGWYGVADPTALTLREARLLVGLSLTQSELCVTVFRKGFRSQCRKPSLNFQFRLAKFTS